MNQELDTKIIFAAMRRHLPAILISTVVGMLLAFFVSNFMLDKQYESTAQIYVSNINETTIQKITTSDLTAAKSMANTYRYIMSSTRADRMLRTALANDPDFDQTYINNFKMTTSTVGDTEIIKVSVQCPDPKMAALICNKMIEVSGTLISDIFEGGRCNSLGEAKPEYNPCFPNVRQMMLIGALLGMALSACIILVIYIADNRVKDEEDFIAKIGIPVLGEVPSIHEPDGRKEGYGYYGDPREQNG